MTECTLCGAPALVQWFRRPTPTERSDHVALVQAQRNERAALADPQQPPDYGPLPTEAETTVPVYACAEHAITLDAAAQVHAADCTAPHPTDLPGCSCTPEPAPTDAAPPAPVAELPPHWAQTADA
ncbi:hypothetical protein [Actinacidiphila acididurans]|uniref:Uncharacterized protein n=1 Tax=Actinacidiphila acididurans TaxID=2784346 RepID=A0ABS2TMH0_9ACTN|nr:hypothetical protein [Actinacidiphila acididurans]MBM9504531.1 hypothetical protein [Actinacidiphila acididurans]